MTGNAPPVPWLKHWRSGVATEPRDRARHFGSRLARAMAKQTYERLTRELGYDHEATRAAFGRYVAHLPADPTRKLEGPESVAYSRELGLVGYLNRTRRRELHRWMSNTILAGKGTCASTHE